MRQNVFLLAVCQALLNTSSSIILTTGALIGVALAPDASLITLPLGLMYLSMMASAMPASLLMRRIGRRAGFLLGASVGVTGGLLCAQGIHTGSFAAFSFGTVLLGVFHGVGQFYRFTAAEVADDAFRSRAISLVMAGGVVAAFAGPNLANLTRDAVAPAAFTGSYLSVVALYLLSMLLLLALRVPAPPVAERSGEGRPLREIARQPVFLVAAFGGMTGYGVMNLLMTSTPLAMAGSGYPFSDTAWVIQWHVLGMFAPSFFTGHVIRRIGSPNVVLLGASMMLACTVLNLLGVAMLNFWSALLLLGVGWNFMFIGSTTLLTECYRPAEKARAQGLNDLLVFGTVALTATTSGALHQALGWDTLNLGVMPAIGMAVLAVLWLRAHPDRKSAAV